MNELRAASPKKNPHHLAFPVDLGRRLAYGVVISKGDDEMQTTWADVQNAIAASAKATAMGYEVADVVDPMRAGSKYTSLIRAGRMVHAAPRTALKIVEKNA